MDRQRPTNRLAPPLVVVAILSVVFGGYFWGYFNGGIQFDVRGEPYREFRAKWQCAIYYPIGIVEAKVKGTKVALLYPVSDLPHRWADYSIDYDDD